MTQQSKPLTLNPSEAPAGYRAVLYMPGSCAKCAFQDSSDCVAAPCIEIDRDDGMPVYFVPLVQTYKARTEPGCPSCMFKRNESCSTCEFYSEQEV